MSAKNSVALTDVVRLPVPPHSIEFSYRCRKIYMRNKSSEGVVAKSILLVSNKYLWMKRVTGIWTPPVFLHLQSLTLE